MTDHEKARNEISLKPYPENGTAEGGAVIYTGSPEVSTLDILRRNLDNCLDIIDNEVLKRYVPELHDCEIIPLDEEKIKAFQGMHFFRITELVYQEDEFSVHKLATVFNSLSNKPCTLSLMIRSNGNITHFYIGVRSRDPKYSTGTMRRLLEQSLLGLFPGSKTEEYLNETLKNDLSRLCVHSVASVTCVADYKQEDNAPDNQKFIQGLEKFVYSMQGKPFTAVFIANNLSSNDISEARLEYERIYTMLSPFANMQYNYGGSSSVGTSSSSTTGSSETEQKGSVTTLSSSEGSSMTDTTGQNAAASISETKGQNRSIGTSTGKTFTKTDGTNESETDSTFASTTYSVNRGSGVSFFGVQSSRNFGMSFTEGSSHSKTHGTMHSESMADTISRNLNFGFSESLAQSSTLGASQSSSYAESTTKGEQFSENESRSIGTSSSKTDALTETFGKSQAVVLNIQNKALTDTLKRLEKQLDRLDECESMGMWDFAAYFLGESSAESDSAAGVYRSLVSGTKSGVQMSAVNTWNDAEKVGSLTKYIFNFIHPEFLYKLAECAETREVAVNAASFVSTNELAIHLGLPRRSISGLSVIEHAAFGREIVRYDRKETSGAVRLGKIFNMGQEVDLSEVCLDIDSLAMHTFIVGATGSGKSNTVYTLLDKLTKSSKNDINVNYMVIEPAKGEYKNVFGHRKNVSVFGTNPEYTALLKINPFRFPKGIHVLEHIDRLIDIFNVCWPMYAAMPAVLKDAVLGAYSACGWDLEKSENTVFDGLYPTFQDLLEQLVRVIDESAYSDEVKSNYVGSLTTRVRSLTNGLNGQIFSSKEIDNGVLFDSNVIVDLSRVGSQETKALLMGVLVMRLSEHRMSGKKEPNSRLRHITVLEEAHNILGKVSADAGPEGVSIAGKSVEMLSNAIAEMRTYGEGFIIADQSPGAVDISAIRNTNTKIIMRLPEESDRYVSGKSAALKDDQIDEIARLPQGVAVVYQNDWVEPVLCKVDKFDGGERPYICRMSAPDESAAAKESASVLINFVLNNRLDDPGAIECSEVLKAIQCSECSVRSKMYLYSMVEEYGSRNRLSIWDDDKGFSVQARLAADILRLEDAVELVRRQSFDSVGDVFTCRLNTLIAQKISRVSDELLLTLTHCLLKAYSGCAPDGVVFYKNWVENVTSERRAV